MSKLVPKYIPIKEDFIYLFFLIIVGKFIIDGKVNVLNRPLAEFSESPSDDPEFLISVAITFI